MMIQEESQQQTQDGDLLPPPSKYVCMHGYFGRLNNIIIESYKLLALSIELKRTFVAPQRLSVAYNISTLQDVCSTCNWTLAIEYDEELCKSAKPLDLEKAIAAIKRNTTEYDNLVGTAERVISFDAADAFYYEDKKDRMSVCQKMFQVMRPRQNVLDEVDRFINDHFGFRPYAAVHVRWLEGDCELHKQHRGLCPAAANVTKQIMSSFGVEHLPLFVASDHQRQDIDDGYANDTFSIVPPNLNKVEVSVFDFEIAIRSTFFVGTAASTAAISIVNFKKYRNVLDSRTMNVLQWDPSLTQDENVKKAYRAHNKEDQLCY